MVVIDTQLLVRVSDGELDIPVAAYLRRRDVEARNGEGVHVELRNSRAEYEPYDEEDGARDYEEGDHHPDKAADEIGAWV